MCVFVFVFRVKQEGRQATDHQKLNRAEGARGDGGRLWEGKANKEGGDVHGNEYVAWFVKKDWSNYTRQHRRKSVNGSPQAIHTYKPAAGPVLWLECPARHSILAYFLYHLAVSQIRAARPAVW